MKALRPNSGVLSHRDMPCGLACVIVCAVAMGMLPGCADPLFGPNKPRSQYDRFDAIRDQHAVPYVFDEFGQRRPNIRGRLLNVE